jgi:NitT/TauT family transport system permease protein
MTNMDALTIPAAGGVDSTALIIGDFSNGNDGIVSKDGVEIAGLKGETINLVELSVSHYLLARALDDAGLAERDVTLVNTSDADMVAAFTGSDEVGTVVTWNPLLMEIEAYPGATRIFDSAQIPGEIIDMMVVNTEVLEANPDFGKALVGAWYETMALMSGDGASAIEARTYMAEHSGTDLAGYDAQLATTKMFFGPGEAVAFANSPALVETMDRYAPSRMRTACWVMAPPPSMRSASPSPAGRCWATPTMCSCAFPPITWPWRPRARSSLAEAPCAVRRAINLRPRRVGAFWLAVLPFVALAILYATASQVRLADNPNDKLLPSGERLVQAIERVATEPDQRSGKIILWSDTRASLQRLVLGVAIAALIGLTLGTLVGLLPYAGATLSPLIGVISMIPPLAVLPILFIVLGLGELAKVVLVVIGIAPFLVRDTALRVQELPEEQLIKAQTLGANSWQIVTRVVLPQILPRLLDAVRLSLGAAWLFLIAAEAIAATDGLGYRIFLLRRYLAMDVILPYVGWITLLAFLFDIALRRLGRRLSRWAAP